MKTVSVAIEAVPYDLKYPTVKKDGYFWMYSTWRDSTSLTTCRGIMDLVEAVINWFGVKFYARKLKTSCYSDDFIDFKVKQ